MLAAEDVVVGRLPYRVSGRLPSTTNRAQESGCGSSASLVAAYMLERASRLTFLASLRVVFSL